MSKIGLELRDQRHGQISTQSVMQKRAGHFGSQGMSMWHRGPGESAGKALLCGVFLKVASH